MNKIQKYTIATIVAVLSVGAGFFILTPSSSGYEEFNTEALTKVFAGESVPTSEALKNLTAGITAQRATVVAKVLEVKTLSIENHRYQGFAIVTAEVKVEATPKGSAPMITPLKVTTQIRNYGKKYQLESLNSERL